MRWVGRAFSGRDSAEEEEAFGEFAEEEGPQCNPIGYKWRGGDEEDEGGEGEEIAGQAGAGERTALEARGDGSGQKSARLPREFDEESDGGGTRGDGREGEEGGRAEETRGGLGAAPEFAPGIDVDHDGAEEAREAGRRGGDEKELRVQS